MFIEQILDREDRRLNVILNHLSVIIIPICPKSFSTCDELHEIIEELDRIIEESSRFKNSINKAIQSKDTGLDPM
jgi:hypothetical protein